ncbi:hypothetical protein M9Y10_009375 [Tritrichomonas musculus]|uniref:MSP domain-containing protein n=1 Tax=Tritrichomonas musculus TaxID=1915356 RepID=A0ABR2IN45_9EUKA
METLQQDLDFNNTSLIWPDDKSIAKDSYVRISPDIMNNLQIVKDIPLMFPIPVINISEFDKQDDSPISLYKKTYVVTQDRNRFLWKDSQLQVLVQIPAAVYNITLTPSSPEWTFDQSMLISPNSKIKAIYPPSPLPPVSEVLEVTLSPLKSQEKTIYNFFNDMSVAEKSFIKIDDDLLFDTVQPSNTNIPIDQTSFNNCCFINYEYSNSQWFALFTIKNYKLTDDHTSVLVKPNVSLNATSYSSPLQVLNIQLNNLNPVYTLPTGIYGESIFSISNELIPDKIITEEANEQPTEYFIQLSSFDQSKEVIDYDIEFDESILFRKGSKLRIKFVR